MPSEHCLPTDAPHVEQQQQQPQVKHCSSCLCQLSSESSSLIHPEAAIVCNSCKERIYALRGFTELTEPLHNEPIPVEDVAPPIIDQEAPIPLRPSTPQPPPAPSFILTASPPSPSPIAHQHSQCSSPGSPSKTLPPPHASTSFADPNTDITRLRVRSHSQDCLYPGAQFSGTQKSGRSSYEVSVTIVDVDFSSSFLCGYLRIRGLTDDWPELTTYFDAQIIGSRYGFLTDDWGATEQEDMTHWARFPSFQKVRPELRGPRLTVRDRDRDCVFMRWKERFLVPDHRVRDINGASFAGFYYVCVEFNPQNSLPAPCASTEDLPVSVNDASASKPEGGARPQRGPSVFVPADPRTHWDSSNSCEDIIPERAPTATMSGFYFHQNSEPYQQLSLRHVPSSSTGAFEFR